MKREKQVSKVELCGTQIGAEKGEKQIRKQARTCLTVNRVFFPFWYNTIFIRYLLKNQKNSTTSFKNGL
jgi:hypothetical protein